MGSPPGLGAGGNTPWIASGWFDYLDIQDATTSLLQGRTGMLLIGAFFADSAPKDVLDDVDEPPTTDSALVRFLQNPNEVDAILTDWQSAAEKIWNA